MDRVHRRSDGTIEKVEHIGIVIGEPRDNQRHTGILYRVSDSDPLEYVHLAGHCRFCWERASDPNCSLQQGDCWVEPAIHKSRLVQVAAICDSIANENTSDAIRTGFSSPVDVFDKKTKKFLLGPTQGGLTCASFVLAVFEHAQLPLVEYSGWPPPDEEDSRWQQSVLDGLRRLRSKYPQLVSQEHIDCVENDVGNSVRYRPEQVAAAVALRELRPVKYRYASVLGVQVVKMLRGQPFSSIVQYSIWDRLVRWFDRILK
jgi:hypothetical protein